MDYVCKDRQGKPGIEEKRSAMTQMSVIIVGAGHGGFQLAASLRQAGFDGRIGLINDEDHPPYQRPPLSKAFIKGQVELEALFFRPAEFYVEQKIELVSGRVVAIDRGARKLRLASGLQLGYGHLVLATGARNRLLNMPNADLPDVRYLRNLDDSVALRQMLPTRKRVVIIGAGFIGLEFAATARIKGLEVDVVEVAPRVMGRAVTSEVSEYFQGRHRDAGIRIHLGLGVSAIEAEGGHVTGVRLSDGNLLAADLVVVGIGVLPNIELAADAGLAVGAGIIVDEYLQTEDPDISAMGDCALFASPRFGTSLRLESVQNATDQARCLAARLTGDRQAYDAEPWFWSDQGEDKLQIVGLTAGYDQVVLRGKPESKSFSVFCYRAEKLLGIESVNRSGDHMFGRRLFGMKREITPEQAADEKFDLKSALK